MTTLYFFAFVLVAAQAKVTITKFENCEANADYAIKVAVKLKSSDNGQQIEEATFSSKIPMGNNILDVVEIYKKVDDKDIHVMTIKENLCDGMNKYMGDFMHELQEAAKIPRGTCPVAPGEYKIKDHTLDFSKFKYQNVPDGEFKLKVNLQDTATNEVLNCHIVEFEVKRS